MLKNKTANSVIALILLLSVSGIMMTAPTLKAQTAASPISTHAYIALSPNPVGINQQATIEMWLGELNPGSSVSSGGHWENFGMLITKPDGTTQTMGPFTANDAAFAIATFTPTQEGNYTLKFSFPGQHVTGTTWLGVPVDAYYGASSFTATLIVQQQPATSMPQASLPTSYWTNPVNSQNSNWYTISGNWIGLVGYGSAVAPFTTGPNSAHILWTKPLLYGGLIGGEFGGSATSHYYNGKSYQTMYTPPIIISGVLYYNSPIAPYQGFYAVDLHTGQTLWFSNDTSVLSGFGSDSQSITLGQIFNYVSPNQEGASPYLWNLNGATWFMYDANTGNWILSITNAQPGFNVEGPNGEILDYVLGDGWLAMWNSSLCITASAPVYGFPFNAFDNEWTWRPQLNSTISWSAGVQWNVTVPTFPGLAISSLNSGVILAVPSLFVGMAVPPTATNTIAGYNLTTGQLLWNETLTLPSGPATTYTYQYGPMADGVFTAYDSLSEKWYGFSATTGTLLWGPTVADTNPWGSQSTAYNSLIAYGILYGLASDGINAFNVTTGQLLWTFNGLNSGTDFPGFSNYPFIQSPITIADGKVYVTTGDSHGDPQFRGAQLYCVDAISGTLLWSISDFGGGTGNSALPISDGILTTLNGYDNQIYAYGMGPSKTTVTAPNIGVTTATPITITGTVTDISAGSSQQAVAANFPNGLPCVSDASMTQFMEAVYMQQPIPTNTSGVPVTLSVLDANGNSYTIGQTTSDASGTYALTWTPPITGNFTITATFAGSHSYYGSSAEAHVYASAPPSAVTPATPTALPANTTDYVSANVFYVVSALIVLLIIIVAVLVLRKK